MYKLVILFLFLFGCQLSTGEVVKIKSSIKDVTFDVVQKKLLINADIPKEVDYLIKDWFDNHLFVNGFEGEAIINITSYNQLLTNIKDGKKIELNLEMSILLNKDSGLKIKKYTFNLNEFSTLTGDFNLNDVDIMIKNTQTNLVNKFSSNLKSKI